MNVYGDGLFEIAPSYNQIWGTSTLNYPTGGTPFFTRGGDYSLGSNQGIFNVQGVSGTNEENVGFRVVLIP